MTHIILCRDLDSLRPHLPRPSEPVTYLIVDESAASVPIRGYMKTRGGSEELPRARLFRERSESFRSEYVNTIGRLNVERASRDWWAMPFTTKNPISSSLCRDAFVFLLALDLGRKVDRCLVFVMDRTELARHLQHRWEADGVPVVNLVKSTPEWQRVATKLFPAAILFLTLRSLWLWFRARQTVSSALVAARSGDVMVTLVHPHSMNQEGRFRDTYFGGLAEQLSMGRSPVSVFGIVQAQSLRLAAAFQQGTEASVVNQVLDSQLTLWDILRTVWESLRGYVGTRSLSSKVEIAGVHLGALVDDAIREAHDSGEVFRSLYVFRCGQRMAANGAYSRCFYPYENRAWEKMLLQGVRSVAPETRMIGFQHASITPSHTNYALSNGEADATPLPDVIITLGKVTYDRLREDGQPPARLQVGCALRQPKSGSVASRRVQGRTAPRLLVALATSMTEYFRVLSFLDEAIGFERELDVRIRPHPTLSLGKALQLLPNGRVRFAYSTSTGSVSDDVRWSDMVLYASSTLGLEAVGAGVPAVFLDLGEFLNTDPMHEWTRFKWVVQEPHELASVLDDIQALSDAEYELRQREGLAYVDAYLAPVTDESLKVFCRA